MWTPRPDGSVTTMRKEYDEVRELWYVVSNGGHLAHDQHGRAATFDDEAGADQFIEKSNAAEAFPQRPAHLP